MGTFYGGVRRETLLILLYQTKRGEGGATEPILERGPRFTRQYFRPVVYPVAVHAI